jgi:hypothetical protein
MTLFCWNPVRQRRMAWIAVRPATAGKNCLLREFLPVSDGNPVVSSKQLLRFEQGKISPKMAKYLHKSSPVGQRNRNSFWTHVRNKKGGLRNPDQVKSCFETKPDYLHLP